MPTFDELDKNFQFIVLEVGKQVEDTFRTLQDPKPSVIDKIASRDDYIDHLKSMIENKCFALIMHLDEEEDRAKLNLIRAVNIVSSNLERIADFCQNIVKQLSYLQDTSYLERFRYEPFFSEISGAIEKVQEAVNTRSVKLGLELCRSEHTLDMLYKGVFEQIEEQLHMRDHTRNLITSLFIFRYLERIGDAILNIGEAVIFGAIGEKLKVQQYEAIEGGLEAMDMRSPSDTLNIESYWGTRSGCRIGRVQGIQEHTDAPQWVIFKEGKKAKVENEKKNIERWQELFPGLPPRIFEYQDQGKHASILIEYLSGSTFQDIVLGSDTGISYQDAFSRLAETLNTIWGSTLRQDPKPSQFMSQLQKRLRDVYQVHPDFQSPAQQIGGLNKRSFESLLEEAVSIEESLGVPFTVLIHGDFNTDNIIYNNTKEQLHFIDVNRSRDADFAQDVSVFMISNFRMPVLDPRLRQRLHRSSIDMLNFARSFAKEHGDHAFDARITLGLVRSLATSTRFELNKSFAKSMFLRAIYLLQKLVSFQGDDWSQFRLPEAVLSEGV